jgi:hypothetical protein
MPELPANDNQQPLLLKDAGDPASERVAIKKEYVCCLKGCALCRHFEKFEQLVKTHPDDWKTRLDGRPEDVDRAVRRGDNLVLFARLEEEKKQKIAERLSKSHGMAL